LKKVGFIVTNKERKFRGEKRRQSSARVPKKRKTTLEDVLPRQKKVFLLGRRWSSTGQGKGPGFSLLKFKREKTTTEEEKGGEGKRKSGQKRKKENHL